jgi:hypothetical protein
MKGHLHRNPGNCLLTSIRDLPIDVGCLPARMLPDWLICTLLMGRFAA